MFSAQLLGLPGSQSTLQALAASSSLQLCMECTALGVVPCIIHFSIRAQHFAQSFPQLQMADLLHAP